MNVEVRPNKTAAEQTLADTYATAKSALPGSEAVQARRDAAFRKFESEGLPNRRVEEWRYTDLRAFMREAKPIAGPPSAEAKELAREAAAELTELGARRLVFIGGAFVAELSDVAALEPGLKITSFGEALAKGAPDVLARLCEAGPADGDLAFGLNTAFMGDGAVIEVAEGAAIDDAATRFRELLGTDAVRSWMHREYQAAQRALDTTDELLSELEGRSGHRALRMFARSIRTYAGTRYVSAFGLLPEPQERAAVWRTETP